MHGVQSIAVHRANELPLPNQHQKQPWLSQVPGEAVAKYCAVEAVAERPPFLDPSEMPVVLAWQLAAVEWTAAELAALQLLLPAALEFWRQVVWLAPLVCAMEVWELAAGCLFF